MKKFLNYRLKPNLPYLFFVAIWFLYDRSFFNGVVEDVKHTVYIVVYVLSLLAAMLIKKKNIGVYAGLIASVGVGIYNIEYIFLFMPVYLVTYFYLMVTEDKSVDKKTKNKNTSLIDSLMVILINFVVAIVVFGVVKLFSYPENQLGAIVYRISYHSVIITAFLLIFLFAGNKRKAKESGKQKSGASKAVLKADKTIRNLNIVVIFIYVAQMFAYYSSAYHNDGHFRIMFFPWFMYILTVIYKYDGSYPYFVKSIEIKIESLINSERDKK